MAELKLKYIQKGFNFSQDGPGNRLVYHLQGCNLKCPWCANPESMSINGTIMEKEGKKSLSCKESSLGDVLEDIRSCVPMFFDSGGVTFTGGEPTIQFKAIKELLIALKKEGIHTAIENNGTHPDLEELLPFIDYLIMDLKHYDSKKHKEVTGLGMKEVIDNLKKIIKINRQLAIRIPLVNGFNGGKEDIEGFLNLFQQLELKNASEISIEFLRYHEYGKEKWKQCNMEYQVKDGFIKEKIAKEFEKALLDEGYHVIRT